MKSKILKGSALRSRILIVDDSIISTEIYKVIFKRNGYTVFISYNCRDIVTRIDEYSIEIVLFDIKMPEINGYEILKLLQKTESTKNIPVIVFTNLASCMDVKKALDNGAFDYVRKSSNPIEVMARVNSAIKLKRKMDLLKEITQKDGLTHIYNRNYFNTAIEAFMDKKSSYNNGVSLIMLDCDNFKSINDRYGHIAGDEVLVTVGNVLNKSTKIKDIACRYGGEEFCLILPDTTITQAYTIAERIRANIEKTAFSFQDMKVNVTVSCGVAHTEFEEDMSVVELIRESDEALYCAKKCGRNRTKIFNKIQQPLDKRLNVTGLVSEMLGNCNYFEAVHNALS